MAYTEKVSLTSLDVKKYQLEKLKELFPEVFTEGNKIDWDSLRMTLGENIDTGKERYGMSWPGRADCFKTIQQPSIATLVPDRNESIDFDNTKNLFIEGDNLEVLKLLQKSYLGKIKMIYIDPPYNTGNDFIYPDNYAENLSTYLEYTGQVDSEGRKFSTNTETDGRFHSKWMNMMYPRLFLAKNLLTEDGVIFISIDDAEIHNILIICNEIFGEENFIGIFVINSSPSAIDYGHLAKQHDYAVLYAKNIDETETSQLPEKDKEFKYQDEDGPFNIYPLYNGNVAFNPKTRPNLYYPFYLNPQRKIDSDFYEISLDKKEGWIEVYPVVSRKEGIQRVWRWGKDKSRHGLNKEIIGYKTEDDEYRVVQKSRHTTKVIRSLQLDNEISSRRGTLDIEKLFNKKVFSFPKSVELIKRFIQVGTKQNDIVLDFFSGSGTTAQAIIELNHQEIDSNRKFIVVQLPELIDRQNEAYKEGFHTIAEIGKERIRRSIRNINAEYQATEEERRKELFNNMETRSPMRNFGFKVFKLGSSNFKVWNTSIEKKPEIIQQAIFDHVSHVSGEAMQESILYELLLKSGFQLTTQITTLNVAGKTVYSVEDGGLLICLEKELNDEIIRAIAELKSSRVICLDEGFSGKEADALKTNAVQIMKSNGVLNFRTV